MKIPDRLSSDNQFKVAAFYSFLPLDQSRISELKKDLVCAADKYQVMGTILLACEGINGTICGSAEGVDSLLGRINSCVYLNPLEIKLSWTNKQAFRRFKVKQKPEIVTMGISGVNPNSNVGVYVEPRDWNDYINDPETLVIDTRNEYEIGIGTFKGALNPHTNSFREFPSWVKKHLGDSIEKSSSKRIAMFCTGGIRCEKATSYLIDEGFSEVHHLRGGVLRYLEDTPKEKSLWLGECFVFDQRVSLTHDLSPGEHSLCYACGMPLNSEDRQSLSYLRGIQCHYCEDIFTEEDRSRFADRQKHFDQLNKSASSTIN